MIFSMAQDNGNSIFVTVASYKSVFSLKVKCHPLGTLAYKAQFVCIYGANTTSTTGLLYPGSRAIQMFNI